MIGPRLARIVGEVIARLPHDAAIKAQLLQFQEVPPGALRGLADAGCGLVRLSSALPDGERGAYIVAHEIAHELGGDAGTLELRGEAARPLLEELADLQAETWGFHL